MNDLPRALASIAADLAEHDQLTTDLGQDPSDYVEVRREDLATIVAAAERHQNGHRRGWINLGPGGLAKLRDHLETNHG
ncbi:hypothetical protein DQ384_05095 [Sphaerisporangium album]|uniref:Uncharacterized protein n=1 Tax=Sphaerisporangium album TaxID=509200 RepID=A0A367FQ09_9ACTN|nr:hypothetical protein [Sphaerisporangium album]RCG31922.1 hypothetical protein DQ384_05095 [Sphaerisporangium album]